MIAKIDKSYIIDEQSSSLNVGSKGCIESNVSSNYINDYIYNNITEEGYYLDESKSTDTLEKLAKLLYENQIRRW